MAIIRITQANAQHFNEILEIMNFEIVNKTSLYDYKERNLDDVAQIFASKKNKNFPFFVALANNQVIGYAYYDAYNPKQGYKYTVEHSIYIKQGFEGKGVGKILMQNLIHTAQKQQIKTFIALIDNKNEASIKFHEKFNFETVGILKEVGYKFDQWLDCRIMQLMVNKNSQL